MSVLSYIQKYKYYFIALLGTLCIAGFLTYSFTSPRGLFSDLPNDLKSIEPSPEFSYTDLEGNTVALSDFKGKPLVVNSWATWIPFSAQELPLMSAIAKEYEGKVTVLAINRMQDKSFIRAYLDTLPERPELQFLVDPNDTFYKAVGGTAMPETVFYNADGVIVHHFKGVISADELRNTMAALVAE